MKKSAICLVGVMLAVSAAVQAQDLEEVLQNHYEAMGGLDKLKSIDTLKMSGRMSMGQGIEAPVVRIMKRPDRIRQEFTVQGQTGIQAYDGEQGWMYMPFMGQADPQPMPEDLTREFAQSADIDGPLVGWQEKGLQVELVGKEDMEGTEAFHITVTRESGAVEHYYLDAEYYIPIKMTRTAEIQGQEQEIEMVFGDYKEVDGLMFPFSVEVGSGQGHQGIIIDSVEVNSEVDDSVFEMPEPSTPEPAADEG